MNLQQKNNFLLEIENDEVQVEINNTKNSFEVLEIQNVGNIWFGTWECQAGVENIELINRDTK